MNTKYLLLIVLLLSISVSAQTIRVVKVLDSNLFLLEDGRLVKLAGVDSPNLLHPYEFYKAAAQDAVEYANINLLDRLVTTETLYKLPGKDFEIVMMYKKYFLSTVNLSTRYLLYGYGKFYNNVDSKSKEEFLDFQKSAINEQRGIWLNDSLSVSDTLDSDLVKNPENYSPGSDPRLDYKIKRPIPIYFGIPFQLFAGTGITFLSGLGGTLIGFALSNGNGWSAAFAGACFMTAGYIVGFPSGVYLVAKASNPDLSYWATVGFSIGFSALTTYISFGLFPKDYHHPTKTVAYLSPIIGSVIYANFIAPTPSTKSSNTVVYNQKQNLTYKDYYNSTILFNADLIRINLW